MLLRPFNCGSCDRWVGPLRFCCHATDGRNTTQGYHDTFFSAWAILCVLLVFMSIMCFLQLAREGLHHRQLIAPMDIVLIPFALIVIEPDLGTSLIVVAIAGVMIFYFVAFVGNLY